MKLTIGIITQESIEEYNLTEITHNGNDYIDIQKGMYGLPQSGRIAHAILKNHLDKNRYQTVKSTPGI